ncbi:MAG TPA: DUF2490 domain-containing protein [Cyclobacteriaceae bacterium]|nr:DUF2490 domain-containing protein [Cyclobacteriaceae bacterium]
MSRKCVTVSLLFLSTSFFCQAQKIVLHTNYEWFQYFNQFRFSKKLTLFSDVSIRSTDKFAELSQFTFRTGIGYPVTSKLTAVTGFACFTTYAGNYSLGRIEFRPYQDVNLMQLLGKVSLSHRFRAEARYFKTISDGAIIASGSSFNFRFRYRLFCAIPIAKLSVTNSSRRLLLNVGDEIFINAGKQITYNTFDNNRFILGSTVELNPNLSFTLNYMYQYGHRNADGLYESSDIFAFVIAQRVALKKFRNTSPQMKVNSDD